MAGRMAQPLEAVTAPHGFGDVRLTVAVVLHHGFVLVGVEHRAVGSMRCEARFLQDGDQLGVDPLPRCAASPAQLPVHVERATLCAFTVIANR